MSKVSAHAGMIAMSFAGGPGRTCVFVAKGDMVVNVVADGLHATPAGRCLTEQRPRNIAKLVDRAIAAGQQKYQRFVRYLFHWPLVCLAGHCVRPACIVDDATG